MADNKKEQEPTKEAEKDPVKEQERLEKKFASLKPLLYRNLPGAFVPPGDLFRPGFETLNHVTNNSRVLVVGAGGLGCEILKDLALSGFEDITVIDMDTIDLSNLNRQFLFRMKHVGQHKAKVAAEFIMERCKGVKVDYYTKPIQEFPKSFYRKFNVVIAGLDNVAARSWLCETLVDLVRYGEDGDIDMGTVIPMIDGGTEGFMGQARMFIPRITSCFDCQMASMQEDAKHFHLCTIADVPRIPEHCIQYAMIMLWPLLEEFKDVDDYKMYKKKDAEDDAPNKIPLDKDDVKHMTWLFRRAEERAKQFGIEGVTFTLTQQVVKNIIPVTASTNALISAACVNEALKFHSYMSTCLNNYMMYMGHVGVNSETFAYRRNPHCKSCHEPLRWTMSKDATVAELAERLVSEAKLDTPAIFAGSQLIYATSPNLAASMANAGAKKLSDAIHTELLNCPDKSKAHPQKLLLTLE